MPHRRYLPAEGGGGATDAGGETASLEGGGSAGSTNGGNNDATDGTKIGVSDDQVSSASLLATAEEFAESVSTETGRDGDCICVGDPGASPQSPKKPNLKPGPAPTNPDGTDQAPKLDPGKDVDGNPIKDWKKIPGSGPKPGNRWVPDGKAPSPDGKGGKPTVVWDPEDGYWTKDDGGGNRTHWDIDGQQVIKAAVKVGFWVTVGVITYKIITMIAQGLGEGGA